MKRRIKFDLPINGTKVATLDELRDHFTTEIIEHFRSGVLAKWLRSRDLKKEENEVEYLIENGPEDEISTLKALCRIFDIEADDRVIEAAVRRETGIRGIPLEEPLPSEEFFDWFGCLVFSLVDPDTYEEEIKKRQGEFRHWVKNDLDKYLRKHMITWSMCIGLLEKCPETPFSEKLSEKWKNNISNCISCYNLSRVDHDRILEEYLSAYRDHIAANRSFGYESLHDFFKTQIGLSYLLDKSLSRIKKSEFLASIESLNLIRAAV